MKRVCHCIAALAALCLFVSISLRAAEPEPGSAKKILCTTFPIYQITRNIVDGASAVTVRLLLPPDMGCPHDYALTPRDMAAIADADVLVVNGLGMEEFLGKPVHQANPDIVVINSSENARDAVIHEHHEHGHEEHAHTGHEHCDHDHGHHHHHDGPNPHLFTSPALSARLTETIAARLCLLVPSEASLYATNAAAYASRLRMLAQEMEKAGSRFTNRRIVEPHGAFDYLARDLGLEIVAHLQPHGQDLSAAKLREVLDVIRETTPGAIVVDSRAPERADQTLSAETGVPVVRLDSAAHGPDDAPLDHYETVMRANLATLTAVLAGD